MIIISFLGTHGDLYSFLALAEILRKNRQNVFFITSEVFQDIITNHGYSSYAIMKKNEHESIIFETPHNGILGGYKFDKFYLVISERLVNYIETKVKPEEIKLILTHGMTTVGSEILYERHKIPFMVVHLTPITVPTTYLFRKNTKIDSVLKQKIQQWLLYRIIARDINKLRRKLSMCKTSKIDPNAQYSWTTKNIKRIALFPRFLVEQQPPDWPIKPENHLGFPMYESKGYESLPEKLSDFLSNKGKKILLFCRSTGYKGMRGEHKKFFSEAVKICQKLNCRGLFIHLFPENIPSNLPEFIHFEKFISYNSIFPYVDCVIHQGGIGTIARAIQNKNKQLIVPLCFDQFANADYIVKLKLGIAINQFDFSVKNVLPLINELFENSEHTKACETYYEKSQTYIEDFDIKTFKRIMELSQKSGN